jgi:hypothetical protein
MTSTAAVFNETFYLTNNADVTLAISQGLFGSALGHYNQFGGKELRAPNSTFNPNYYAINNADVLGAVSSGTFTNVFAHYQEFGETESRAPSTTFAGFNSTSYLAANADVAAAVTAGSFSSALDHFISFGQVETRTGSGVTESTGIAGSTFTLSTGTDVAGKSSASTNSLTSDFRFTDTANETISADIGTLQAADVLLDGSSTDSDVLNITLNGNSNTFTANRIETLNVSAAAGAPVLDMTNVTNSTNVNVSGSIATTIDEINTQSKQPTIKLDAYTRVLTIQTETMSGTTAAGTAETVNVELSGTTFGSTAATRSGVTVGSDGAGTLETLNIASSGTAANDFTLASDGNATLSTVNFTGEAALSTRAAHAEVTGLTLNASAATGAQTLVLDRNTATTTATNANLFSGFSDIQIKDSAAPATGGDGGSLSGLKSGQTITFLDDFNATVLAGSSVSGSADSMTLVLDNETGSTDTDIASVDTQNFETLTIQSSGNATATTIQNVIGNAAAGGAALTGDATTITITGDTSLSVDVSTDTASGNTATRSITVDASANTAFVNIIAEAQARNSYSITGTAGNDSLTLNASGGTLNGGAGNDTLTGGNGNDTIDAGDGTNSIFASNGTDSITVGSGADTITFGEMDITGVAQTNTITLGDGTNNNGYVAGDTVTVTVDSVSRVFTVSSADVAGIEVGNGDNDLDTVAIATGLSNFINQSFSQVSASLAATPTNVVTLTAGTAGTSFTATVADSSTTGTAVAAAVIANVAPLAIATTVTNFSTGTTDDIISFDVSEINALNGITDLSDGDGDVAGGDAAVILNYTVGIAFSDTDGVSDGQNIIKAGFSNTLNSDANFDAAYNANTITLDVAMDDGDVIAATYYDADDGNMIMGFITQANSDGAVIDDDATFTQISSLSMTSAEYTALSSSNFTFVT